MLNTNPAGLDLAHTLPTDWIDRVLTYKPTGTVEPLVKALQAILETHGNGAIAIQHVQDLALRVCGFSDKPLFGTYKDVFELLTSASGSNWPVTIPLDEQILKSKPIFDAAQRLVTCDGEWLVLSTMVKSGWIPIEITDRCICDWTISRDGNYLPVEVKTKQGEGSDLGRLRFALRGLSMIPEGKFMQNYTWNFTEGLDLTRPVIAEYYKLLKTNLAEIDSLLCNPPPLYEMKMINASSSAVLSFQHCEGSKFSLRFEFTDQSRTKEEHSRNHLYLIAKPNPHPRCLVIDAVSAYLHRDPDDKMLAEIEEYVFNRLDISAQASKRPSDTLVVIIWEVPFYWTLDLSAVETRWSEWCTKSGVKNGILLPFHLFAPQSILCTNNARTIFSDGLDFYG